MMRLCVYYNVHAFPRIHLMPHSPKLYFYSRKRCMDFSNFSETVWRQRGVHVDGSKVKQSKVDPIDEG